MKRIAILCFSLLLTSCVTTGSQGPAVDSRLMDLPDVAPVPTVDEDGGFTYTGGSLFSRRRARAVGDLLTIRVVHKTSADTSATTSLKRKGEVAAGVTALMGLETALASIPGGGPSLSIGSTTQNDYDGEGSTNRIGTVQGTLTTRV
ncbi:MAG: flagellar basal body L-ring protein FlgH, partial [Myxococcota bacterium]|nr:flagellar basal body L-ring protein FlgH [Myxococcota bacterium]